MHKRNKFFIFILTILLFSIFSFADVHFGIISAVKKKIKDLKEKKDSAVVVKFGENTVQLSEPTLNNFSRQEGDILYFNTNATELENIKAGEIIISNKGEGFLRKVVSINKTSDEYVVITTSSTLEEAFEELQFNTTKKLQMSDLSPTQLPRLRKGVYIKESPSRKFGITISKEFELYNQDGKKVTLEGSLEFDIELNCEIEIKRYRLRKVRFTNTLTQTGTLEATVEVKKELSEEIPLGTLIFAPIVVGPVTLVPEVKLLMGISMEGGIVLTAEVGETSSLTAGLEYNDGSWIPIGDFTIDFNPPQSNLTASGEIKAYLGPQVAVKIYGVVGPKADLQGYFKAEAQLVPIEERFFKIYGGIECNVGVEFTILSFFEIGYEKTVIDWKRLIYEADLVYFGTPPKLLWTGEPNFTGTGVYPEVGVTTHTFVYRVKYIDTDNNEPAQGYPKVHILKNGQEINGSPFTMYSTTYNPYYNEGVIYEYATRLSSGNYSYYFEAKDIMNNVSTSEQPVNSKNGPTVTPASNRPPVLHWTGEPYYNPGGVYPYEGKPDKTPFVFRVLYGDPDGDDGYVSVHIKKGNMEIIGSPFSMNKIQNYTNGGIYSKEVTLPYSGNDYKYYFEATDIYGDQATGEATQVQDGPVVDITKNHPPELSWLGTGNYASDGLDPEKGKPLTTLFRYEILYKDIDNDSPKQGYPKLHIKKGNEEISGSPFTMSPMDFNYRTGVEYYYNLTLSSGTDYSYYFEAYDVDGATATGSPVTTVIDAPDVESRPPELLWVGDTNYENDGLHPETGRPNNNFVYRIKYKDLDGDAPKQGYPKLHIKKGGFEILNSPFTMTQETPGTNYTEGIVYRYTTKLSSGNDYSYYFEAYDVSDNKALDTNSISGPVITNQAPVLSWTGETNYITDGIDPDSGRPSTPFQYRVKYTDPDNDPPMAGYPKLHILKDGVEIQESPFEMVKLMGEGSDYTLGVKYAQTTVFSSSGNYTYYFEAKDECNTNASGAPVNITSGPVVANNAPVLSWTGETNYETDGVNPDSGRPSTYTFRVKYSDQDGEKPLDGYPKVHILKGGVDISSSPFTMNFVSGNYTTGAIYTLDIKLSTGDYTYYFEAKDTCTATATGIPTQPQNVISVYNNSPELLWTGEQNYESDGLNPETGISTTTFVYRIKYKDPDNDPPLAGYPKLHIKKTGSEINNSPFAMNFVSSDTTGSIYTASMTLLSGIYSYYFEAKDIYEASAGGVSFITKDGPYLSNSSPTLTWTEINGVYPSSGSINETFLFQVKYQDIDNDPPAQGYPKLYILKGGSVICVTTMTPNGDNYISGVTYSYGTKLSSGTNYSFYFEAKDINYNIASGTPTVSHNGPNVYSASYWVTQTVDMQNDVGKCSSIKVDSSNYPYISYTDTTNYKVKYAKWTGTSWSTYTITDGDKTSIAIYNSNNIYISYYFSGSYILRCAKWNGSAWNTEDVLSSAIGYHTSIAVGSDNIPQIAYACYDYMEGKNKLIYTKKPGSSWSSQIIETEIQCNDNSISMALDNSNYPHIAYFIENNLKYAKWTGTSWSTTTIDTQIGSIGHYFVSIAVKNNIPYIAYYDGQNKAIKYAKWTGTSWSTTTVFTLSNNYDYVHPSIAVDNSNNPYIVYCLGTNYSLRYARWNGTQWEIDNIPIDNSILCGYPSVAIDSLGKVHISYYDSTNGDIEYARYEP